MFGIDSVIISVAEGEKRGEASKALKVVENRRDASVKLEPPGQTGMDGESIGREKKGRAEHLIPPGKGRERITLKN